MDSGDPLERQPRSPEISSLVCHLYTLHSVDLSSVATLSILEENL